VNEINLRNACFRKKQESEHKKTKEVFSHRRKVIHQYTKLKTSLEYKRKRQPPAAFSFTRGKYS
jgi:hypothetical protein